MPKVKFPKQEFFHCNVTHDDEKYNSRENIVGSGMPNYLHGEYKF